MKNVIHQYISKGAMAVAFLGLLIMGGTKVYWHLHPVVAINVPIQIRSGIVLSEQIETAFSETYEINLTVSVSCGLNDTCPTNVPELSWSVHDQQTMVATNRVSPATPSAWSGDFTSFQLGTFKAEAGKKYKLEVSSNQNDSANVFPEPKLKVSLGHIEFKDVFVTVGLFQYLGLMFLVLGLIVFVGVFAFKKLKSTIPGAK